MKAYIKNNLQAILIGFSLGLLVSFTYTLIENIVIKIALIHDK